MTVLRPTAGIAAVLVLLSAGYGVPDRHYRAKSAEADALRAEVTRLEAVLDDVKHGAARLYAHAEKRMDGGDYKGAAETAQATAPYESVMDCEPQGIGPEEEFARKICAVASEYGFKAELVHSYGAGGIDIFISVAEAAKLRSDPAKLRRQTAGLGPEAWPSRSPWSAGFRRSFRRRTVDVY
jgi:hypothetical protein